MAKPSLKHVVFGCLLLFLLFGGQALGQTVTGTITGIVTDPSGLVIAGAGVTLTNDRTGESRTAVSSESGAFIFTGLPPATYSLKVELTGFKTLQRTGMVLSATERLSVGTIPLSLGSLTETVTVEARGAAIQTTSAEQSSLISSAQMETMLARGRDVIALLRIVPGVQYTEGTEVAGGTYGVSMPNASGVSASSSRVAIDGLLSNDMGTPSVDSGAISMDAVGEMKLLINNYQAEYGGNGGMSINIVSKSGGRDFRGSAYWFKRHEMFNANNFFNNRTGVAKPRYRYNTIGGTISGPAYIPKVFNTNKDKWFFFMNLEEWRVKTPGSLIQNTMPTELERAGDFSQTLDVNDKLIAIKDPLTGKQFLDNKIPASRINIYGQRILKVFPPPNFFDRTISKGNYNRQFQEVLDHPHYLRIWKADWVQSPKNRFSWRLSKFMSDQGGYACASCPSNWGLTKEHYYFTEGAMTLAYTRIFTPKVVNEFNMGARHNRERWFPDSDAEAAKFYRSTYGLDGLGMWHPENNPRNLLPQASFGGVQGGASISYDDRVLTGGADVTIGFYDTLSIIRGSHLIKVGVSVERTREYEGEGQQLGNFNFGKDTNNPNDSNYAYSNALLGNFVSYMEQTTPIYGRNIRSSYLEWFGQDTWKVNRKLTLDYGLRFTWYQPLHPPEKQANQAAIVALERYDAKKAAILWRPVMSGGKRMAQNPLTGAIGPAIMIGAFVTGSGDTAPGAVLGSDKTYPLGWVSKYPIVYGPRLGIAYDPFGKGKTAIRAGTGMFYTTRISIWSNILNAPARYSPYLYYGNIDTFRGAAGTLLPTSSVSFEKDQAVQSIANIHFGIQQDIGMATVLDVSYVSTLARHLRTSWNLSTMAYGTRFLPQNQDSTTGKPLPDIFLNRTSGYSGLTYYSTCLPSNYHSLRVAANRRFTKGLQYGVAYTWSKTMDYSGVTLYRPMKDNYGLSGMDFTHNLVINYIWDIPKGSRLLPNPVSRLVLDNWQLSGITAIGSGGASGVGFSTVDGTDQTGGGDGQRIIVTGDVKLPRGERSFSRWFNTASFKRPGMYPVVGNAGRTVFRLPGRNVWDISLFKNILVFKENRYFQFRLEMYNAFNHTQWSGVDSTARFDATGNQVNAQLGQVTSARDPRRMQMSLRFNF